MGYLYLLYNLLYNPKSKAFKKVVDLILKNSKEKKLFIVLSKL